MTSKMTDAPEMFVVKRDGTREPVSFDKVLERIRKAATGLSVNYTRLAQLVLAEIHDGVHTTELDELAARLAVSYMTTHPDWGVLAAQIIVSNCQRSAPKTFSEAMEILATMKDSHGVSTPALAPHVIAFIRAHATELNAMIDPKRDFLLDYFGFKTLERAYLMRDRSRKIVETPQFMWLRVAVGIWASNPDRASAVKDCEGEEDVSVEGRLLRIMETYELMSQKAATHATPTLFNSGTPRPQLSSCFLVAMKEDSIEGIFDTLKQCAQISKYAGGIGLHIHNIRAQGSYISGTQGNSNGLVPMLRVFNNTARYVDQGGGRRNGSFAIYLEPWHADIQSFLKMKSNTGSEEERARDLFYALWIPDLFMKRVEAGGDWSLFCPHEAPGLADVHGSAFEELYTRYEAEGKARRTIPAQKLWSEILVSQIETGTPYLLYKDAVNAKSNQMNLGTIKSSNLCVAPETYILTDKGQYQIHELVGKKVNVWNGEKWSETTVMKTGENQRLLTVSLSNGAQIHCTPYHKFLVREGYTDKTPLRDAKRVDAADLKEGMKLAKFTTTAIEGDSSVDIPYPYTHGFFCGDGTISGKSKTCTLYGAKKDLLPHLAIKSSSGIPDAMDRINCVLDQSIPNKYHVPINSSKECRLKWFAGLCDADGAVCRNGDNESLQVSSIHLDFLDNIRLLLQTLGISSKVTKVFGERQTLLPDGHGGRKVFDCKPLWRILVSSSGLYALVNMGFKCNRLSFTAAKPQRNAEQFVYVVSVVDDDRTDDTYCFNEPENHAGVFNGILTGNCTEITEYSDANETAVCNLASIALPHFARGSTFNFDALRACVHTLVRNLNRVIDINYYPTPETRHSNMRHRPIGLGIQGLADVFALLKLPWESQAAADLNQEIFEHIYFAALEASVQLAAINGPYETFVGSPASKGRLQPDLWGLDRASFKTALKLDWSALTAAIVKTGLRNSLLVAPMPTASTSQILGYNECFEPFTTNIYVRRTLAGEFTVVNKYLIADLMSTGLWSPELKERIIAANGSIQAIPEIPTDIRERYKTVWEIKQKTLIDMAAARGAFICQSQSLNLFVADPTIAKLSSMHFYAWKRGLKTGIYYLRTKSAVQAIKFTVDPRLLQQNSSAANLAAVAASVEADRKDCLLCSS
jgi:ribonucleoside-diphosphate reductase alpha chain